MIYMNFAQDICDDMLILIKLAPFSIHDSINQDLSANIILILLCEFNYSFN